MRVPLRVLALIALFIVSCGVGLGIGASAAFASDCPPGSSTCTLTDFTGSQPGTDETDTSGTLTGANFSASYKMAAYYDNESNVYCGGCIDFYVQVTNDPASASDITEVSLSDFQGVQTDMGSRTDGSEVPGSGFDDGGQTPDNGARSTEGDTITWQFGSGNGVAPGETSAVLDVQTTATSYDDNGTASAGDGSSAAGGTGLEPTGTKIFTTADPSSAPTGITLQDSATLSDTKGFDGTGYITFNLYGPGDNSCASPIYTETVNGVSSDGPFTTTTGFTPTTPGTYNWTAAFSGDPISSSAASTCGAEPVTVTSGRTSQITRPDATCSQFAQATATTLYHVGYTVKKGKVETASPGDFIYWLKVPSTGGNQSVTVTQFTDEASRPFQLASGSAAFGTGCTTEPVATSQSGGDGHRHVRQQRRRAIHVPRAEILDLGRCGRSPSQSSRHGGLPLPHARIEQRTRSDEVGRTRSAWQARKIGVRASGVWQALNMIQVATRAPKPCGSYRVPRPPSRQQRDLSPLPQDHVLGNGIATTTDNLDYIKYK